jgi:MoaA/NifB/PqqE/SkfB family radical SAM enzyme
MSTVNKLSINTASHSKIRAGAGGLHLFDRNTGVNILMDEISLPPSMWSTAPRQVSIALTNACDLVCSHCYAPKNPATLNFERLTSWLTDLDANGCIGVGFGGGEPTLYPRLAELCSYGAQKTGLAVTMTTHAHHLSDSLLGELSGSVHFIRVSMDGVEATYEAIRGRSFATLIQRIKALSKHFSFGINFVVNSKTIDDLDKAIDLSEELGCSEFLLLPEEATLKTRGTDGNTRKMLQEWVANYRGRTPLAVSESGADGLPICNPLIAETGLHAFAHIDASGILKRTSYSADGVRITEDRVIPALYKLAMSNQEVTS